MALRNRLAPSITDIWQIAQAADQLSFHGVLLPTGRSCEDAWVVASTLVPATTKLKFLVAIRPGITSPTAAARMAATFDRLSEGRLLINVVTGGDPDEALGVGVFLTHDERYEVTEEFLQIWREAVAGNAISLNGKHLHVEKAKVLYPAVQKPMPSTRTIHSSDLWLLCSIAIPLQTIRTLRLPPRPTACTRSPRDQSR